MNTFGLVFACSCIFYCTFHLITAESSNELEADDQQSFQRCDRKVYYRNCTAAAHCRDLCNNKRRKHTCDVSRGVCVCESTISSIHRCRALEEIRNSSGNCSMNETNSEDLIQFRNSDNCVKLCESVVPFTVEKLKVLQNNRRINFKVLNVSSMICELNTTHALGNNETFSNFCVCSSTYDKSQIRVFASFLNFFTLTVALIMFLFLSSLILIILKNM